RGHGPTAALRDDDPVHAVLARHLLRRAVERHPPYLRLRRIGGGDDPRRARRLVEAGEALVAEAGGRQLAIQGTVGLAQLELPVAAALARPQEAAAVGEPLW